MKNMFKSPATAIALVALFFAVGGSALAFHSSSTKTSPYQLRCQRGTIRGIAYVTGDPKHGITNLPMEFSSSSTLFGYRYNCSGRAVEVRVSGENTGFDVLFPGNSADFAVANIASTDTAVASVTRNADGSFHVAEAGDVPNANFRLRTDLSFVIIVF